MKPDERGFEDAITASLVEDSRTCDVRRHEVGRELDPGGFEAEDSRERTHDERLCKPGHVLQEHVAPASTPIRTSSIASRLPTTARSTSATTSRAVRATSSVVNGILGASGWVVTGCS